jgi:predicted dehydrogenase
MEKKIKIGFIGSGWSRIAQAPAFSMMEGVELAAVASPTELNRQKFMTKFDISKGFADWRDMLQQCELDLVCVTTPTYLHRDMVTGVLQSGKSVLCEKPFALNTW